MAVVHIRLHKSNDCQRGADAESNRHGYANDTGDINANTHTDTNANSDANTHTNAASSYNSISHTYSNARYRIGFTEDGADELQHSGHYQRKEL